MRSRRGMRNQRNFRKTKSLRKRSVSKKNIRKTNRRLSKSRNLRKMRSKGGFKQSRKNRKRRITRKRGGANEEIVYEGVPLSKAGEDIEAQSTQINFEGLEYKGQTEMRAQRALQDALKKCNFKTKKGIQNFINSVTPEQITGLINPATQLEELNCIVKMNNGVEEYQLDSTYTDPVLLTAKRHAPGTTQGHRDLVGNPEDPPPLGKKIDREKLTEGLPTNEDPWKDIAEDNPLYGKPVDR